MKGSTKWVLIAFCLLMVAGAMHSAWKRHQGGEFSGFRTEAQDGPFVPRQSPVSEYNIARELNDALADAVEIVMPSVVVIRTPRIEQRLQLEYDPYGIPLRLGIVDVELVGEGSGVIIDERGYILTSWHVLEGAAEQQIYVVLNDETKLPAQYIGHDKATDLAVLKIEGDVNKPYPTVPWGNSDDLRVGEMVIAIGSPFSLQSSVAVGHVSQKGRRIQILPYEDFIQTNIALNEGNSGGPLIDVDGRLVGINAAIWAEGSGIAFAVPAKLAMVVANSLKDKGVHEWPWVGAFFGKSMPEDKQVQVVEVWSDTPAARADLQPGDVVLQVNGKEILNAFDIYREIYNYAVGTEVNFLIQREGRDPFDVDLRSEEFQGIIP